MTRFEILSSLAAIKRDAKVVTDCLMTGAVLHTPIAGNGPTVNDLLARIQIQADKLTVEAQR